MTLIDANVILRYLLNDIPEQADKAESVIKQGSFTLPEIIAEVVYVLIKLYKVPRNEIKSIVAPIFNEVEIQNKEIIVNALSVFSETAFDFVDCIIISRKKLLNENVFTFDKKLSARLK